MSIPELVDLVPEHNTLEGSKVKIDSILNLPLTFTGWELRESKHKKDGAEHCLTLQFDMNGIKHVVFTGSNVLIEQVNQFGAALPADSPRCFRAKIVKIGNYYKFARTEEKNALQPD